MRGIGISSDLIRAIHEACMIGDSYITLGFTDNCFIVAVQNIRGYISVIPVKDTMHPKFMIRINKDVLQESVNGGFITVEKKDDKTTEITTYRDEDCEELVSQLEFASSYSDTLGSFMDVIKEEKLLKMRIQQNILTQNIFGLLTMTGDNLNSTDTDYVSTGNGISVYVPAEAGYDKVTIDLYLLKMLQKNIKGTPEVYYNGEFKTYMYKRGNTYFTWRSEYNKNRDLSIVKSIKPIATMYLGIPTEMPMTSNRKFTKAKETLYTWIDLEERTYSVTSNLYSLKGKLSVDDFEGEKVTSIKINSIYVKYLVSNTSLKVEIFKKFIRVASENAVLDIACDVIF